MFYSGETIFTPDDRLHATDQTGQQSSFKAKRNAIGHGLKRLLSSLFHGSDHELEQIARDPRMLDDIGLTRADVESVLRRREPIVLSERYLDRF